jgi:hypothetical protein
MLDTKQRRVSISYAYELALKGVFQAENSEAGGWSCMSRLALRLELVDGLELTREGEDMMRHCGGGLR